MHEGVEPGYSGDDEDFTEAHQMVNEAFSNESNEEVKTEDVNLEKETDEIYKLIVDLGNKRENPDNFFDLLYGDPRYDSICKRFFNPQEDQVVTMSYENELFPQGKYTTKNSRPEVGGWAVDKLGMYAECGSGEDPKVFSRMKVMQAWKRITGQGLGM